MISKIETIVLEIDKKKTVFHLLPFGLKWLKPYLIC